MPRRLLLLAAALASLACLPAAALEVERDNQTYVVKGSDAEEIRASLDRLGPTDPNTGLRFDALTRWFLEWRFDTQNTWQGCEIIRVWTLLRVSMLLPRHASPSSLPDDLRQEWTRYMQRLTLHEEGHLRFPTEAAREIETRLDRMRRSDCAAVQVEANRLGSEALQRARALERSYDVQTDHGRTQGARFPWIEGNSEQLTDSERLKLQDRIARPP